MINKIVNPEKLAIDVENYIAELKKPALHVSRTWHMLNDLYSMYGRSAVDAELERAFDKLRSNS